MNEKLHQALDIVSKIVKMGNCGRDLIIPAFQVKLTAGKSMHTTDDDGMVTIAVHAGGVPETCHAILHELSHVYSQGDQDFHVVLYELEKRGLFNSARPGGPPLHNRYHVDGLYKVVWLSEAPVNRTWLGETAVS